MNRKKWLNGLNVGDIVDIQHSTEDDYPWSKKCGAWRFDAATIVGKTGGDRWEIRPFGGEIIFCDRATGAIENSEDGDVIVPRTGSVPDKLTFFRDSPVYNPPYIDEKHGMWFDVPCKSSAKIFVHSSPWLGNSTEPDTLLVAEAQELADRIELALQYFDGFGFSNDQQK